MAKKGELTDKQSKFCDEYNISLNATQAYKKVYKCSLKCAEAGGSRTLSIVKVKTRVKKLKAKAKDKAGVTNEMITAEFKKMAFKKATKTLTNKNKISALENLGKHVGYYEKDNQQKKDNLADFLKAFKE